jgi:hypothetical protein
VVSGVRGKLPFILAYRAGDMWTTIHKTDRRHYLLNAYRVLLTRARQGMVIFVPPGDASDATRAAEFYDQTYAYLSGIGIGQA